MSEASSLPSYRRVGRGVSFARTLVADLVDMVPALGLTTVLWRTAAAPHPVAFALGFAVWVLNPILARSLSSTSLGGGLQGLEWAQPSGQAAPFTAHLKFAIVAQVYACFAVAAWAVFAAVTPWRLLNPATYKAFAVPNTELFGIIVERRAR